MRHTSSMKDFFAFIWFLIETILGSAGRGVRTFGLVAITMVGVLFYEGLISTKILVYSLSAATTISALVGFAYCIFAMQRQYRSRLEQKNAEDKNALSLALTICGFLMLVAGIVNGCLYSLGLF